MWPLRVEAGTQRSTTPGGAFHPEGPTAPPQTRVLVVVLSVTQPWCIQLQESQGVVEITLMSEIYDNKPFFTWTWAIPQECKCRHLWGHCSIDYWFSEQLYFLVHSDAEVKDSATRGQVKRSLSERLSWCAHASCVCIFNLTSVSSGETDWPLLIDCYE